jgi:hypothetical protein
MMKATFIICLSLMVISIGIAIGLLFGEARKDDNGNDE